MIKDLSPIERIATQTRRDFEADLVTDDEIIAAAIALNSLKYAAVSRIGGKSNYQQDMELIEFQLQAGTRIKIDDKTTVPVPIVGRPGVFPVNHCDVATIVLSQRLKESDALGENKSWIIEGGCGEDDGPWSVDGVTSYDAVHTFLGIGDTVLSDTTIVDITADQFRRYSLPAVYVGPLKLPWTTNPELFSF